MRGCGIQGFMCPPLKIENILRLDNAVVFRNWIENRVTAGFEHNNYINGALYEIGGICILLYCIYTEIEAAISLLSD